MSHGLHPLLEQADLRGRPVADDDHGRFMATYGHLFEHSPWVVERAWALRPFDDAKALHCAFLRVLAGLVSELTSAGPVDDAAEAASSIR